MIPVARIVKDYKESGAFSALVSVQTVLDDQTFLTKSGDLLTVLRVQGPDPECLEASELDQFARRFESAVRGLSEDCRFYQYWIKRNAAPIPAGSYQNPIVQEAVASRAAYLEAKRKQLCATDVYFVLVYEGTKHRQGVWEKFSELLRTPLATIGRGLSDAKQAGVLEKELERARAVLTHKVMTFIVQMPDALHAKVLDKQQAFRFLRGLVNYAPYKAESVRLKYDGFVDFQLCDSALECYPDHLRLDNFYVQVLTLKEPPAQTLAHLFRGLEDIPCNVLICSEWKRQTSAAMRGIIQSKRRHFHNKKSSLTASISAASDSGAKGALTDHSAVAIVDELGSCLEEIELGGHTFGEFSMTVVLYDEDRASVRRAAAECFKVFATHDAQLTEERYNVLNSWLAVFPGNGVYNLRKLLLLDTNYADLSFLFAPYTGETENAHLRAEYLAVFETEHHAPYFFNLHHHDVAHTAIFGATGSGKSFLLDFLLTHLQKYAPLTIIFDLGGSYESLTRLFEGAYFMVGVEKQPFSINPFRLAPTPGNLQFLFAFVKVLLESGTFRLSAQDEHDLFEQIKNLFVIEPDQRRLLTLANMLSRTLRVRLQKWVEGGPYAAVFDNVEDNLTFASFQTFDFQGMDKVPEVLQALLFFILHRAKEA